MLSNLSLLTPERLEFCDTDESHVKKETADKRAEDCIYRHPQ